MNIQCVIAFISGICLALPAYAGVTVTDAWVKATAPGQTAAVAYLKITSDAPAKLVGVSSPVAKSARIHETRVQDNVMHMRPLDSLDLPVGRTIELKPGGYHIMLTDIAQPLKPGATVPLTLTIEGADMRRQSIEVNAEVRSAMSMEKHEDMGNMGDMKGMGNGY